MNGVSHQNGSEDQRRLLVVGQCDIKRALRKHAELEVLSVRTGTDALGEITLAHAENRPIEVVLLGEGVIQANERAEFETALRTMDAGAAVIDAYGASEQSIFDVLNAEDEAEPEQPVAKAAPPDTVAFEPGTPSEHSCVDAVLVGNSPIDVFLAEARMTTGDASLRFERTASSDQDAQRHAEVRRREARFGHLYADQTPQDTLDALAAELAGWLALYEQQRQLRTAAFTDQLTGAWNRRYFDYFLPKAIEEARERRNDVTLMVYDLDDFKTYNDRYGHAAGDEILQETVRLLLSVIRPTDRVCRIGGDEFAVIFDDPTGPREGAGHHPTSIAGVTSRFQRQICEHRFPKLSQDAPGTLTISGGMATFPWDGVSAEELLERADALAMQSKRQGKNLITFGPGAQRVCGLTDEHGGQSR